ncbi:MAG: SIMPL domain-containing protein [Acidithiobacillus sp.]|uniref:SIMPL domain-containing protein n=1 Tax=Acidithiobacillus sp. TaxID=1872118 RepID=UPI003D06BDC4
MVPSYRPSAVLGGLVVGLFLLSTAAWGDGAGDQDRTRIELSTTEDYSVPATLLQAELSASADRDDPASAAASVNASLQWASRILAKEPAVHWQNVGYRSFRVEVDKRSLWRVSGSLMVEAAPSLLGPLLAQLQTRLQIVSTQFVASPAAHEQAEKRAATQALQAWRKRAEEACTALGLRWGGIDSVRLSDRWQDSGPRPVIFAAARSSTPPEIPMGEGHKAGQVEVAGSAWCRS